LAGAASQAKKRRNSTTNVEISLKAVVQPFQASGSGRPTAAGRPLRKQTLNRLT
jgi:hypothetical protein